METQIHAAPAVASLILLNSAWETERRAFKQMLPTLLVSHANQYVAIHGGKVVETGSDQVAVALAAYARCGYVPIYVGLATNEAPAVARVPSPRNVGDGVR